MSGALLPEAIRDRFHLPSGATYLKSHSVGCQPRAAEAALRDGLLAPWRETGEAWPDWLGAIDTWRAALAATATAAMSVSAPLFELTCIAITSATSSSSAAVQFTESRTSASSGR